MDKSDEFNCRVIDSINGHYLHDRVPAGIDDKYDKLNVTVSFDLVNIGKIKVQFPDNENTAEIFFSTFSVDVSEKNLLITLKLDIHLVWLEHRLNFLNLRTNSIQNIIKSKTAPKVCQRNSSFL